MKTNNKNMRIFTTGAFLSPMKTADIDGNEKWVWCVSEFIDDSFRDGEIYNPLETADSNEKLILELL